MGHINKIIIAILLSFIKAYQLFISPMLPKTCRHLPTCSEYAIEAIKTLGPIKGSFKAIIRILKCNPLGSHGYDPVIKRK
jgi:putative membrane protein insertion efficiency factor|tara:strand:- start:13640 stop:13879 length:240 start_codon:yes stop_codon:yes gene_type:complete